MDERTKLDTLTTAIKGDPVLARTAEQLVATPVGAAEESPEACQTMCQALLVLFMSAATAMLAVGLLGCVWLGWIPPFMALCIMGAITAYTAFRRSSGPSATAVWPIEGKPTSPGDHPAGAACPVQRIKIRRRPSRIAADSLDSMACRVQARVRPVSVKVLPMTG
ncbi:hypothetical protein HUT06_42830 [Actinomadura sp. NAK00032]|uniref:hypothetical protein n=1 Tax=Actinomadura sp. NAK00032 TaxID=2742128 RepID=UPI00159030DF|nr:hypothetical protein [Actinomadura sp. NAK00032]QKW39944.1 hypothetical protein HUT06_42830 [Actinomadura sp. NAK00032]